MGEVGERRVRRIRNVGESRRRRWIDRDPSTLRFRPVDPAELGIREAVRSGAVDRRRVCQVTLIDGVRRLPRPDECLAP